MYWDDEEDPSVECPLGDFFCCGFGVSYQVNSVPIAVNPTRGFNSYFPMPFRKTPVLPLKISVMSRFRPSFYQIDYCLTTVPEDAAYFHAQWRRQRITEKAKTTLSSTTSKGKASTLERILHSTSLERYWYGEGEMKFYIDGDKGLSNHLRNRNRRLLRWCLELCNTTKMAKPLKISTALRILDILTTLPHIDLPS